MGTIGDAFVDLSAEVPENVLIGVWRGENGFDIQNVHMPKDIPYAFGCQLLRPVPCKNSNTVSLIAIFLTTICSAVARLFIF